MSHMESSGILLKICHNKRQDSRDRILLKEMCHKISEESIWEQ